MWKTTSISQLEILGPKVSIIKGFHCNVLNTYNLTTADVHLLLLVMSRLVYFILDQSEPPLPPSPLPPSPPPIDPSSFDYLYARPRLHKRINWLKKGSSI